MATHERELTEAVDLCVPNGSSLNPAARGWSRRPLHRANLAGAAGSNKRWDYWAIQSPEMIVSLTYADVDFVGLVDLYWAHPSSGETGGCNALADQGELALPELCGTGRLLLDHDDLRLSVVDDPDATVVAAAWTEADGRAGRLDARIERPPDLESVNVVIPWSDERFNFTSKQWGRPVTGELVVGDRRLALGPEGSGAWGTLDVGRGRWPSLIRWNWGGGAGRYDGHVVALQVGAKWTEGTGFTENGIIVDGRLSKIGRELVWDYDWLAPMRPWSVTDPGGQLDVVLTPYFDKHGFMGDRGTGHGEIGNETHQVFGTWSGRIVTDDGIEVTFDGIQGFAEEARQNW